MKLFKAPLLAQRSGPRVEGRGTVNVTRGPVLFCGLFPRARYLVQLSTWGQYENLH
jgi:hypothetical protein